MSKASLVIRVTLIEFPRPRVGRRFTESSCLIYQRKVNVINYITNDCVSIDLGLVISKVRWNYKKIFFLLKIFVFPLQILIYNTPDTGFIGS
ncbi:unnamed protein product [Rhizophagus irregularis]|nr:unnamed protein product [Rhizophagus irregularis]